MRIVYFLVFVVGVIIVSGAEVLPIDAATSSNIEMSLGLVAILVGLLGMLSKQSCDAEEVMEEHIKRFHT